MIKSKFGAPKVLVIIPCKSSMNRQLQKQAWELAQRLPLANENMDVCVIIDSCNEVSKKSDTRPWSKVSRVRNRILKEHKISAFSHILWIDADVVDYPANIPSELIETNSSGVSAPLVFIENSKVFYDTCAFVIHGQSWRSPDVKAHEKGRQLDASDPYWPSEPPADVVDMDCVGTVYLVNTDIYRSGARHRDHPAFTDHWSICEAARTMGRRVTVDRKLAVYHAELPKYGEEWH